MTANERMFPILGHARIPHCPSAIPWRFLAPHEEQARRNHSQSLETLARRGGLGPLEAVCVIQDQGWEWLDDYSSANANAAATLNVLLGVDS